MTEPIPELAAMSRPGHPARYQLDALVRARWYHGIYTPSAAMRTGFFMCAEVFQVRSHISTAKRVVVKVGTSTLTHPNGLLHLGRMEALVRQLYDMHAEGRELILVTSGAVGAGMGKLGMTERPMDTTGKQALAAVGQGVLMQRYEGLFGEYGCTVGQVLLTRRDLEHPDPRESAAATMEQLLKWRVIPVVNENDTVTNEEIRVGDNDTLSARVASLLKADLLILLTDVSGFYSADPKLNPHLTPLDRVVVDDSLEAAAGGAGSSNGTGGMITKVKAARICAADGIKMIMALGGRPDVLRQIMSGEIVGTLFEGE